MRTFEAALAPYQGAVEEVLRDPAVLLDDADRRRAFVDALRDAGRPTARYERR
jgi:hypothetical protein